MLVCRDLVVISVARISDCRDNVLILVHLGKLCQSCHIDSLNLVRLYDEGWVPRPHIEVCLFPIVHVITAASTFGASVLPQGGSSRCVPLGHFAGIIPLTGLGLRSGSVLFLGYRLSINSCLVEGGSIGAPPQLRCSAVPVVRSWPSMLHSLELSLRSVCAWLSHWAAAL